MDENKEYKEDNKDWNCPMCNHPVFKHVVVGLMVFLGAFAAFYVVVDMHIRDVMNPVYQIKRMEKRYMKEQRMMDRYVKRDFERGERLAQRDNEVIHLIKTDNNYKIIIDLNAFDNNENNVEVRTNGRVLTIVGAGIKDTRAGSRIVKFSQSYMFGDDVDLNNLTKMRDGNEYIITIPIED